MFRKILFAVLLFAVAGCKNTSEEADKNAVSTDTDTISVVNTDHDNAELSKNDEPSEVISEPTVQDENKSTNQTATSYKTFGDKFVADNVLSPGQMLSKYKNLKTGDTIAVKFKSSIKEVCKKKGCWMSMALPNAKESFVRFKDYGFFVPLNADGSEAIISGRAYVDVITVADQQHYAKDGGKSQQEIDKITEPKVTYAFQADGVQIRE